MPDVLTPEARQRAADFCKALVAELNLPDTTLEELEDHFQDRMLGYLNGTDPISEEDAFVLAREHFGDPDVVRSLFVEEPPTRRVPGYRWFLAGAGMTLLGFLSSFGLPDRYFPVPVEYGIFEGLLSIRPVCFTLSLVILGLAFILVRRVSIDAMDRILGWYFLMLLCGYLLVNVLLVGRSSLEQLLAMPLNLCVMFLQFGLITASVICFFRHRNWGKWLILALILLPFASDMFRNYLDDEKRAVMAENHPFVRPHQPIAGVTHEVATRVITVPPRGFPEALYVLALLHAFLPRRPSLATKTNTFRLRSPA